MSCAAGHQAEACHRLSLGLMSNIPVNMTVHNRYRIIKYDTVNTLCIMYGIYYVHNRYRQLDIEMAVHIMYILDTVSSILKWRYILCMIHIVW